MRWGFLGNSFKLNHKSSSFFMSIKVNFQNILTTWIFQDVTCSGLTKFFREKINQAGLKNLVRPEQVRSWKMISHQASSLKSLEKSKTNNKPKRFCKQTRNNDHRRKNLLLPRCIFAVPLWINIHKQSAQKSLGGVERASETTIIPEKVTRRLGLARRRRRNMQGVN